ncbi:MAG: DUF3658 domain-containing protein [Plesiomonas sp.]|uniref:DUF3658 domain-containing protein n=1 Tax=Plesiomonas sp. TaxID=2486279 RepID=UPI003F3E5799
MALALIHIISDSVCAATLREMLRRAGRIHEKVVVFDDTLCHGDLTIERKAYWQTLMSGSPTFPFSAHELTHALLSMQKPLALLSDWLVQGNTIQLWLSESLQDVLMQSQVLRNIETEYQHRQQVRSVHYLRGEQDRAHLRQNEQHATYFPYSAYRQATELWQQLVDDRGSLRYQDKGKIVSVPENLYDPLLLDAIAQPEGISRESIAELDTHTGDILEISHTEYAGQYSKRWSKALMVVAKASACIHDSPGYEFLLQRLLCLIKEGRVIARHMHNFWPEVEVSLR